MSSSPDDFSAVIDAVGTERNYRRRGEFSTQYVVQRFINGFDCARSQCILLTQIPGSGTGNFVWLRFRSDTPVPDVVIRRRSDGVLFYDNTYTSTPKP